MTNPSPAFQAVTIDPSGSISTTGGAPVPTIGETDGNFPAGGYVGELEANYSSATGNATSGTAVNAVSAVLSPGNWDIYGLVNVSRSGITITGIQVSISAVSATHNSTPQLVAQLNLPFTAGQPQSLAPPAWVYSSSVNFAAYVVATVTFTGTGPASVNGNIQARRAV